MSILISDEINEKAVQCFDKAIQIRHSFTHAWSNKGYALNSLGRYTEAVECFDKALELDRKLC